MKFRTSTILMTLTLAATLFVGACGGGNAANNANNVGKPTPLPSSTTTVAVDSGDKAKIEAALKAAGFTDVTVSVDSATGQATLRGTVPKGKLQDMMKATTAAAAKPVKNEVTEK